ncbi:peptidase C14 [Bacillus sp. AFS015802]|jgi:Caspase domain|uniref:caspase family protein n=1 Tax=Bacillaceae TaxID=186817 RepID=UPI000BF65CE3|nr:MULTISPECIES: caspase family protein [Bacillaceae]MEC1158107.1 caspase family protein [Cytobacillus horneckiae]MED2936378.1 caspase family protein [Cytobacillus horneckiae]PFA68767.1 peptidase C14 [Bacillus sp. AFS015802]
MRLRKALVVGLNDYEVAPLEGCVNDAVKMETVLTKNGDGSPNFQVKHILGSAERKELRQAIEELFQGEDDVALFYFSGHGLVKNTGGYIVTTDAESYDEGVSMAEIMDYANNSNARDRIIILDCCNSGKMAVKNGGRDPSLSQLSDNLTVLTSSRGNEFSMEKDGSGVFTSLLLDALEGGAADLRGNITPGSVYSYIDEALGSWEQRPVFKTNVSRFTSLRQVTPLIPLDTLRKITTYFEDPNQEIALDPTFEYTEPNHNPDNVKVFKDLQKFVSKGLVVPVGEEHMYYAAMNSGSCKLTALGYQYWRLVNENKL